MARGGCLITDRDRAHFAAIAGAEKANEAERQVSLSQAHLAEMDAVADGQLELARRRIALGPGTRC